MKPSELRIGNWIQSETEVFGEKKWRQWQVTAEDIPIIDNDPKHYKPILLSEEWPLKFGFKKDDYEPKYSNGKMTIVKTSEGWEWENVGEYNWSAVPLKFVHNLQNLYFQLYDEELTIK